MTIDRNKYVRIGSVVAPDGLEEGFPSGVESFPPLRGIIWQVEADNVGIRRQWDLLGVTQTLFRWVAVDGKSFIPQTILPLAEDLLDLPDIATYPWARGMTIGTPGLHDEAQARLRVVELAQLAAQFQYLNYPANVNGFYFPVRFSPSWTEAPAVMAPLWSVLPRPLSVSLYYDKGVIDSAAAARWARSFIPADVTILFHDGVGEFGTSSDLAAIRMTQIADLSRPGKAAIVADVFRSNPNYPAPGQPQFIPVTASQYRAQVASYSAFDIWAFDAAKYLTTELIQEILGYVPVRPPIFLDQVRSTWGDLKLTWGRASDASLEVLGYRVRVFQGLEVFRTFEVPNQLAAFYSVEDQLQDFGSLQESIAFDVSEISASGFTSDPSAVFSGPAPVDNPRIVRAAVGLAGDDYMGNMFTGFSDLANPVMSDAPGAKNQVAVSSMRRAMAAQSGLNMAEILPIDLSAPRSFITKIAADIYERPSFWWDTVANVPGPAAIQAQARIAAAGVPLTDLLFAGGREPVSMICEPTQANVIAQAAAQGIAAFLATTAAPTVWTQPHLRAYYGVPPLERIGTQNRLLREAFAFRAATTDTFKIGSWVPPAGTVSAYWDQMPGDGYILPVPQVSHVSASELGEAMALDLNRVYAQPVWAALPLVAGVAITFDLTNAARIEWTQPASLRPVRVRLFDPDTYALVRTVDASGNSFTWSQAMQTADTGGIVNDVRVVLSIVDPSTQIEGVGVSYVRTRGSSTPAVEAIPNDFDQLIFDAYNLQRTTRSLYRLVNTDFHERIFDIGLIYDSIDLTDTTTDLYYLVNTLFPQRINTYV